MCVCSSWTWRRSRWGPLPQAIVAAMGQDASSDRLQVAGCTALRVLCHASSEENEIAVEVRGYVWVSE